MTRDHGRQDIKAKMSIEWLEELETSIGNIEAKAEIPKPFLYKDSVKKLASMLRNILVHIIIYEHDAAPESRRGEMLVHLGDRLKQFDQTATKCERFVDMLSGRSLVAAIILRGFDMKMINVLHEEIKMREQDLETGIRKPREALLVSKFVGTPIFSLGKIYSAIGNKLKASLNKGQEQRAGTHFRLVLDPHSPPSPHHRGTLQSSRLRRRPQRPSPYHRRHRRIRLLPQQLLFPMPWSTILRLTTLETTCITQQ
ncbi:hypothetical protein F5879DRAFT_527563 [Lentinula edodes]|nr:hypothetical protein F5879DRAFT_527563 [Lentinula edodes]